MVNRFFKWIGSLEEIEFSLQRNADLLPSSVIFCCTIFSISECGVLGVERNYKY